jgi:4-amino-4-deoxy-L-arabinose transferase-like glycosyltransferase
MALVAGLALAVLLVAPLFWLSASYHSTNEGGFPVSGPIVLTTTAVTSLQTDPKLINYLEAHSHGATFLVASVSVQTAIPIIWVTNEPVMAMGGYSGYDPILTPTALATLVRSGRVRLFLLPSTNLTEGEAADLYPEVRSGEQSFQTQYTNQLTRWVSQTCTPVSPVEWQTDPGLTQEQLFSCSGG